MKHGAPPDELFLILLPIHKNIDLAPVHLVYSRSPLNITGQCFALVERMVNTGGHKGRPYEKDERKGNQEKHYVS
jgi:hypothetical protein